MNIFDSAKTLTDLANQAINGAVVRPTGSPNEVGIDGYIFDIIDAEDVSLDSEITDHYVENNIAVQDHIALRPERFTLRGFVAEVRDVFPNTILSFLTGIQSLGTVGGFLPGLSIQATQVYGKIAGVVSNVQNVVNQVQNAYDMFTLKSTTATRQQEAYKYFYDLWFSRTLCRIETPFGVFEDMAIENVRASQSGASKFMSDFSVTFKKIRKVKTVQYSLVTLAKGRASNSRASFVQKGQTPGQTWLNNNLSLSFPARAGV